MTAQHRVVIVGGGFAGLCAARGLARAPAQVTLIDRKNHHLFQPLLYQVATGALSPANIAAPLRSLVKKQRNTRVELAEVKGIDLSRRELDCGDKLIAFDTLIVATGSTTSYFGKQDWQRHAPGLKTIEDARTIRHQVLTSFEKAERAESESERAALLTFLIVGGGPTGVELAGAISEVARGTLKGEFRRIDPATARVLLLEGEERILGAFSPEMSAKAVSSLQRLGVDVRTSTRVETIEADSVQTRSGEHIETIRAATVLWAAGVTASPLGRVLSEQSGAELDRGGRVTVRPDCSLPGFDHVFVLGDLAHMIDGQSGKPLPGLAPVAMQQGRFVAKLIHARLSAGGVLKPFHYTDRGNMATIGRKLAVAEIGSLHVSGFPAWMAWLFIHLMYLAEFENRLLVLFQWAWSYATRNRTARLISKE